MDNQRWEKAIKEALIQEVENQPAPDYEKIWNNIEGSTGLADRNQGWFKVRLFKIAASAAAILVLVASVWTAMSPGESSLITLPIPGFAHTIMEGGETLTQSSYERDDRVQPEAMEEEHLSMDIVESHPEPQAEHSLPRVVEERATPSSLTVTNLEELLEIYDGNLYYPENVPREYLERIDYMETEGLWSIKMFFSGDDYDLRFFQRDLGEAGSEGITIPQGADVKYHHKEEVEYMLVEEPFGTVNITWIQHNRLFQMIITVPGTN